MVNLRLKQFEFKPRVNVQSYQSWEHKLGGITTYTIHLSWNTRRNAWEIELEMVENGKKTSVIDKMLVRDISELSNALYKAGYPPVADKIKQSRVALA